MLCLHSYKGNNYNNYFDHFKLNTAQRATTLTNSHNNDTTKNNNAFEWLAGLIKLVLNGTRLNCA